jgi:hypothetical protein
MKKIIFVSFCLLSGQSFGQLSKDTITINQLVYDPIELGNRSADCLKTLS